MASFMVTGEHIKLLQRLNINENIHGGFPTVDPKRPFGNSDVYRDMAEILDHENTEDGEISPERQESYDELLSEMKTVLEILISNLSLFPGEYRQEFSYSYPPKWEPVPWA